MDITERYEVVSGCDRDPKSMSQHHLLDAILDRELGKHHHHTQMRIVGVQVRPGSLVFVVLPVNLSWSSCAYMNEATLMRSIF